MVDTWEYFHRFEGITTTIELHKKILKHKKFLDSSFDTNWLGKEKFF